jgi:hypothetical protein
MALRRAFNYFGELLFRLRAETIWAERCVSDAQRGKLGKKMARNSNGLGRQGQLCGKQDDGKNEYIAGRGAYLILNRRVPSRRGGLGSL